MADIIELKAGSATEQERQRFEEWASGYMRKDERFSIFSRNVAGDYVLPATRAAWAAWQARGMIMGGTLDALQKPPGRVLAVESALRGICALCGADPAEGVMMLMTAAAHTTMIHSALPWGDDQVRTLGEVLMHAIVAAEQFFPKDARR